MFLDSIAYKKSFAPLNISSSLMLGLLNLSFVAFGWRLSAPSPEETWTIWQFYEKWWRSCLVTSIAPIVLVLIVSRAKLRSGIYLALSFGLRTPALLITTSNLIWSFSISLTNFLMLYELHTSNCLHLITLFLSMSFHLWMAC